MTGMLESIKFGSFGSDSLSDCSNKRTSYWIDENKDHIPFWEQKI